MDNKRVLLAFALSFAVILAFRWAFPPATEPVTPPATPPPPAAATVPATPPPSAPAPKPNTPPAAVPQELHADLARGTEFETSLYKATVYNEGGVLKSFLLKTKYLDAAGRPLELINGVSATSVGWPLAISTGDSKLDAFLSHAVYVVKSEGNKISLEFAGDGILINEVAPGNVDAGLSRKVWDQTPGSRERAADEIPVRALITPQEVARQVAYLCDPENRQMTGSTLLMDGGLSLTVLKKS